MAQEHLTTFGASESRWVRSLVLVCGAAWCIASVGCGHDEPRVLGPGLDPPKGRLDGGAGTGDFGNGAKGGSGGSASGSGGRSAAPDDDQVGHSGNGGNGEASADAAVPPSICPPGDAGVSSSDAGALDAGVGCDEDAGVSR